MEFKTGVSLKSMQPQILLALLECEAIYKKRLLTLVVTSVTDGKHKVGSKHYEGLAADLRTKGTGSARSLYNDIKKKLQPIGFDVILEFEGGDNEHIHVEFDPHN